MREIAHAAIDVSDGLIADLGHLASASGVRIVVEGEQVPLSAPLRALWGGNALLRAVVAGDDYQIAFTAPARAWKGLSPASAGWRKARAWNC